MSAVGARVVVSSRREAACQYLLRERMGNCAQMSMAYLSGRDDLERAEGGLEIGGVGLEVVERAGNGGLELGWLCARWAVRRDLVEGTHVCGCREVGFCVEISWLRLAKVVVCRF